MAAVVVMVALSICVFTVVKVFHAPGGGPEPELTPVSSSTQPNGTSSGGQQPTLPELSEQTRRQLQAPAQVGPPAALPSDPAGSPSPDSHADSKPDSKPDSKADSKPDWRPDSGVQASKVPQNSGPRGAVTRAPNVQPANPGRATPPGAAQAQRSAGEAGPDARNSDGSDVPAAADDPDTAAPAEPPRVIYVPETPEERDARMRRELADSVCDQYGVARETCRARTARH